MTNGHSFNGDEDVEGSGKGRSEDAKAEYFVGGGDFMTVTILRTIVLEVM